MEKPLTLWRWRFHKGIGDIMNVDKNDLGYIVNTILDGGAKQVSLLLSKQLSIKGTFQGRSRGRARTRTIVLTIGRPNYRDRVVIKKAEKTKEPFPLVVERPFPKKKS